MAMKVLADFSLRVIGDGVSRSIAVPLTTLPVNYPVATPKLSSALPTTVLNPISGDGQQITAVIDLLGVCTFQWPVPVPDQTVIHVYGQLVF